MSSPLAASPPVGGGVDVTLPGAGVRLRATRWAGTGAAVLLLHGLASTRRFWDLVVPGLAGLPVVALDQRGHGGSDRPTGPYDGATVVADVVTALDALGLSRVVVVGHSWGATTALRLAAVVPQRVLAVVAVDGGLGVPHAVSRSRAEVRELLTPPRTALPPDDLLRRLAGGPLGPWWSPAAVRAVLPLFELGDDGLARPRLPFDAHMAILDDLLDTDHHDLHRRVRCPTWLVACVPPPGGAPADVETAAKDHALTQATQLLSQPRALRWQGAVHDVPLQWPALVAGLVRAAHDETTPRGEGEAA